MILLLSLVSPVMCQQEGMLYGTLRDSTGMPVPYAHIFIKGLQKGTISDSTGYYFIQLPAETIHPVSFSCVGYEPYEVSVMLMPGERRRLDPLMKRSVGIIDDISVTRLHSRNNSFHRLDIRDFTSIPSISGQVESALKTFPGVSSSNELSSQYSVRGGNFDENLVYVNEVEVYRPFLIRSGQQEGLSFINSDLVSSIRFSAGGFDASYGDKMSSVLDIHYRTPEENSYSASASFLGGSAHLEGVTAHDRLTYLAGFRYKSNQYLLSTLDVKGNYKPVFIDVQTFITYKYSGKLDLSFLGNISDNRYRFIPEDRITSFGTVQNAVQLYIDYEGQETDRFSTILGAFTARWKPLNNLNLRFISSIYNTSESETFDIQGRYSLNELDKELGSENLGDSVMNIGIGRYLNHARNYLDGFVSSFEHKGSLNAGNNYFNWGLKYQHEWIDNQVNEWELTDSAGFSVPNNNRQVNLSYSYRADLSLSGARVNSYVQYARKTYLGSSSLDVNAGIRSSWWNINREWLISPRFSLWLNPNWRRDFQFYLSGGYYYQPAFFKEMRDREGHLNRGIRAQKSVQLVLGTDYTFLAWDRPFKYTAEIYYKSLDRLVPYRIDNVRIVYAGKNMAHGYAAGIDMKVNGEFVPGVESWASLSIMQTREDIRGDRYLDKNDEIVNPGYYPRPSDQLFNFGMYFQDYMPADPSYRVQFSLHYGSGLPTTPPYANRYDQVFRMPPYRRVDIGFTKVFKDEKDQYVKGGWLRPFSSFWISAELFNLLDINNTISYQWVTTIHNLSGQVFWYAVPNYLTSRRLNIRVMMKF